jgi:hypothetical protein
MTNTTATRPRAASDGAHPLVVTIAILAFIFSPVTIAGALYAAHRVVTSVHRKEREALGQAGFALLVWLCVWFVLFHQHLTFWGKEVIPADVEVGIVGVHIVAVANIYAGFFAVDLYSILFGLFFSAGLGWPVGMCLGVALVRWADRCSAGAEWHPLTRWRALQDKWRQQSDVIALSVDTAAIARCSAPPLGVSLDGDLRGWTEGPYVVVPPSAGALGLLIAGEPGSGKTVTLERKVALDAAAGRQVIFVDCKGTDPDLPWRIEAAYRNTRPTVRVLQWPGQPLSIWKGDPAQLFNKLKASFDYNDPYWEAVGDVAVRLALTAPDLDGRGPCRSTTALLERMTASYLKRAYAGTSDEENVASVLRKAESLDGLRMRMVQLFDTLHGGFDGDKSFEDFDLIVLTVPSLAIKNDAEAMVRLLLSDFGQYAAMRKPRRGRDATIVIDEFSAVTTAAPVAINLTERIRDVGAQLVVAVQSWEGLGTDDDERRRLRNALAGGVLLQRMPEPEQFLQAAGAVRQSEVSAQIDDSGSTAMGSMRSGYHFKIRPDDVRSALVGEAWLIHQGQYLRLQVLPNRGSV